MSFLTIEALRNPLRESGFNYVGRAGGAKKKPWRAQRNAGQGYGSPSTFRGPTRATPEEAAQDYCDYANGRSEFIRVVPLKMAGHDYEVDEKDKDPEYQAALGVLRDRKAQRAGKRGYVYAITDGEYIKIGYSVNPKKRVAELQTGNARLLSLLGTIEGTEDDERAMHAKYAHLNVLQEWFLPSHNLIAEFTVPAAMQRAA